MYVSYLLEKDGPMYPGPVRHSGGLNLAAQNFVGAPQYADYGGYHVNLDGAQSPGPAWPAPYAAPLRDDWGTYGQGAPNIPSPLLRSAEPRAGGGEQPAREGGIGLLLISPHRREDGSAQLCPLPLTFSTLALCSAVKTRTKDKYRVVYTDHQRLELEKEFHYSRYITIRRKAELASNLGLSERQVCPKSGGPAAGRPGTAAQGLQEDAEGRAGPGGAEGAAPPMHCTAPRGRPCVQVYSVCVSSSGGSVSIALLILLLLCSGAFSTLEFVR
uniref:Caudal type homeobox 2 n=1 Tax=Ficedula albicollis TaxID=59894 RepID=U3KK60_FICAL